MSDQHNDLSRLLGAYDARVSALIKAREKIAALNAQRDELIAGLEQIRQSECNGLTRLERTGIEALIAKHKVELSQECGAQPALVDKTANLQGQLVDKTPILQEPVVRSMDYPPLPVPDVADGGSGLNEHFSGEAVREYEQAWIDFVVNDRAAIANATGAKA